MLAHGVLGMIGQPEDGVGLFAYRAGIHRRVAFFFDFQQATRMQKPRVATITPFHEFSHLTDGLTDIAPRTKWRATTLGTGPSSATCWTSALNTLNHLGHWNRFCDGTIRDLCRVLRLQRHTKVQWLRGGARGIDPWWTELRSGSHYGDSNTGRPSYSAIYLPGPSTASNFHRRSAAAPPPACLGSPSQPVVPAPRPGSGAGRAQPVRGNAISAWHRAL